MDPRSPPEPLVLRGVLVDGAGEGRCFTAFDWVRRRFRDLVGIDPSPGTVNLRVEAAEDREALDRLRAAPGIAIPPEPGFCAATAYRVAIQRPGGGGAVPAAMVVPHVPGYPGDQVELVAAVHVRTALGLTSGDLLTITFRF
jgi:CTP-dependent riboflavin kinase